MFAKISSKNYPNGGKLQTIKIHAYIRLQTVEVRYNILLYAHTMVCMYHSITYKYHMYVYTYIYLQRREFR